MTTTLNQAALHAAARACHEANLAYCAAIGDFSQVPWDDAPEWQRETVLAGAEKAQDPETVPETSHESWTMKKHADGWVYGEIKDSEKKTHPCMMAWAKLPMKYQVKDELFLTVARATYQAVVQGSAV